MFGDNIKYYLEKMKWSIETLQLMGIDDNYTKQLNNFYKYIEQIMSEDRKWKQK